MKGRRMSGSAGKAHGGGGVAAASGVIVNGAGGRFVSASGMTPQRDLAAEHWANGDKPAEACRKAGYADPDSEAQRLKRDRAFIRQVARRQRHNGVAMVADGVAAWRRVASDNGAAHGDVIRAGDRLVELGLRLRDEAEKSDAAEDGPMPIADDSGRGGGEGISPELSAILAHMSAATATTTPQPTDNAKE